MFNIKKKNGGRASAMQDVATSLGMSYRAKDEYGTRKLLGDFELFKRGGRKKVTNLMKKTEEDLELNTNIFDYQYTVSTGKSAVTLRQTVFFVQSKQLALPQFLLKPEHFFHRIGTYLGMQDIDFVDHPEFSRQYLLQGEDEDFIRRKLDADFRSYFTVEKNWTLEGLNYFLIFYRNKKRLAPEEIPEFYRKGKEIYQLIFEKKPL